MSEVAYEMLPIRRAIPNPMIVGKSMPMTAADDVESQLYSRREAFFTQDWLFRSDTGTDIFGMCCIARSDNQGIQVRRLDELSADGSAFAPGTFDAIIPARFASISPMQEISAPEIEAVTVSM